MHNSLNTHPLEEDRRKRILYRALHRGCKETDIVLGRFAEAQLDKLTPYEVALFENLLDEQDWDIWDAVTNPKSTALDAKYATLIQRIKHAQGLTSAN